MAFIDIIPNSSINDEVRAMYARQEAHWGFVPNYAKVFCHRPEIMRLWAELQIGIKRHMSKRRFELVTFVSAIALRSTLCSLGHGKALTEFLSEADVLVLARGGIPDSLTPAEAAMVSFARKVARDASSVEAGDVEELKRLGFTDGEVFDVASCAGARAFWTKLIEALGVEPEPPFRALSSAMRTTLAVGRPLNFAEQAPPPLPERQPSLALRDDVQ
jgi:uncharacterized peroxidase-related enzyme